MSRRRRYRMRRRSLLNRWRRYRASHRYARARRRARRRPNRRSYYQPERQLRRSEQEPRSEGPVLGPLDREALWSREEQQTGAGNGQFSLFFLWDEGRGRVYGWWD